MSEWTAEDDKLVTLARGARGRISAPTGAALRDTTGRTYSSGPVNLDHFTASAVALVVAQAAASGATGIEAVVLCASAESDLLDSDVLVVADAGGSGVPVSVVTASGERLGTVNT